MHSRSGTHPQKPHGRDNFPFQTHTCSYQAQRTHPRRNSIGLPSWNFPSIPTSSFTDLPSVVSGPASHKTHLRSGVQPTSAEYFARTRMTSPTSTKFVMQATLFCYRNGQHRALQSRFQFATGGIPFRNSQPCTPSKRPASQPSRGASSTDPVSAPQRRDEDARMEFSRSQRCADKIAK